MLSATCTISFTLASKRLGDRSVVNYSSAIISKVFNNGNLRLTISFYSLSNSASCSSNDFFFSKYSTQSFLLVSI